METMRKSKHESDDINFTYFAIVLPRELCCSNFVLTALFEIHSSNLRSKSWNSKYRFWKPSASAADATGWPFASHWRACNVSRAETKNTRSSASFGVHTFSSLTRKSAQRSWCWARTYVKLSIQISGDKCTYVLAYWRLAKALKRKMGRFQFQQIDLLIDCECIGIFLWWVRDWLIMKWWREMYEFAIQHLNRFYETTPTLSKSFWSKESYQKFIATQNRSKKKLWVISLIFELIWVGCCLLYAISTLAGLAHKWSNRKCCHF